MTSALHDRLQGILGDDYAVIREVGSGGMATVYLARDRRHDRDIAVKVLRPELSASMGPDRFLREIKIAAGLHHPHVLQLYDSGAGDGLLYFTMPFVEGESLADRIDRETELPIQDVIRILKNVADGLAYAHGQDLIHRDIKPGNVLLQGRHALIADFGVARAIGESADGTRMTSAGVALGTPAYMAPEQIMGGERVDHRADIYGLGCMAYAMLTGEPPFGGAPLPELMTRQLAAEPAPIQEFRSSVPDELARVVMRCLEKKPADRWQDCGEIVEALEAIPLTGATVPQAVSAPGKRPWPWNPAVAAAAVVAVAVLWGGAVSWGGRDSRPDGGAASHQQVSFSGNVLDAVISPDGQFIARVEELDASQRIVVHDLASGAEVELDRREAGLGELAWSPDGSRIIATVFTDEGGPGGSVFTYPRLGGDPRRVTGGATTTFTATDGQFVMGPENWQGLLFYDARGGPPRWVAFRETLRLQSGFAERPGGASFAVAMSSEAGDTSQLLNVRIDGDQRAGPGPGDPSAAPPPEVLAQASDLVPTWAEEQFTLAEEAGHVESPRWAPDGGAVYYLLTVGHTQELRRIGVNPDGTPRGVPETLLTGLEVSNYAGPRRFSISGDGDRLVYAKGGEFANLWTVDLDQGEGAEVRPLTRGTAMNTWPKLSPDGTRVVYVGGRAGARDLFSIPAAGGAPRRLTFLEAVHSEPAWSPDGSVVAGVLNRDGRAHLFIVDLDAPSEVRVLDGPMPSADGVYVDWTPHGSIVYVASGRQNLRVFDPETGQDRAVLEQAETELGWFMDLKAHPRDAEVAVWWGRFNWPDRGLYALSLTDGTSRRLAPGVLWPAGWSSDGRWVFALDEATRGLFRVSVASGDMERLTDLPGSPDYGQHTSDGRRLVMSIPGVRADAWSIENFAPSIR